MAVGLAAAAAAGAARGGTILLAVGACAVILATAAVVAFPPEHVFLGWLLLAPFVQGTVGSSGGGHTLRVAIYSAPPLLFAFWTLTTRRTASLAFVDAMPLLYLVIVIISALAGQGHPSKTTVYSIVGVGVVVYFFLAFGPTDRDIFPKVARILLLTGCASAAWVMISRATGIDASSFRSDTSSSSVRAAGTFGSPALLGTFLGIVLVLAVTILAWRGPQQMRRLCWLTIVVSIPALGLTLTRGPLIAAGAVALLVLVTRARTRWGTALGVALALLVIVAEWGVISSTHLYKSRFSDTQNVQLRVALDHVAVNLAEQKPVFGWGYGSFDNVKTEASFNPSPFTREDVLQYTSHNTYLTVLAETGVVGLVLLLIPLVVLARRTLAAVLRSASERWVLVALVAMLGVWLLSVGTYDVRFFSLGTALPWVIAGLMRRFDLDRQTSQA